MKLITQLHLVPKIRAIGPLPTYESQDLQWVTVASPYRFVQHVTQCHFPEDSVVIGQTFLFNHVYKEYWFMGCCPI